MLATEFGIVTDVRDLADMANDPMLFTVFPFIVLGISIAPTQKWSQAVIVNEPSLLSAVVKIGPRITGFQSNKRPNPVASRETYMVIFGELPS